MVFWLLPRTPGYVNGPRSVAQKAGCEGPSNIYYLCYLLLPIITYYWLLLPRAMYWSIMMENDNTRRDQIDICNMAHETNKAMSDQSNTLWLAGGEGDQGSTTFFIDTFILGNQGQVFLFSHLIPNLIYALYWNAHFKTIQGTQSGRFFTQSLRLDPIDSGSRSRYIKL